MPRSVLIPITNVHAKGDYTARVYIGSQRQQANLILDSGSSSLVVQAADYDPNNDDSLSATSYAQAKAYGMGGWAGPVIKTDVELGRGAFQAGLKEAHLAVTRKEQTGCFGDADGILGLAYGALNRAHDLSQYLAENQIDPAHTYPWYLAEAEHDDNIAEFRRFLRGYPQFKLDPYFTQLEQHGVVGNQFAFVIHRSSIYQTARRQTAQQLANQPLNNGIFVIGHPKVHEHLYDGQFAEAKVLHDKYYNVHLRGMRVGAGQMIPAPELEPERVSSSVSNAIVDSGASMVMLPKILFEGLFEQLIRSNSAFESVLAPFRSFEGVEKGIAIDQVDLADWPDITFILDGFDDQPVNLVMKPESYWQTHAPAPGQVSFQFVYLPSWPNQAVLGLPLMTNYYTIFDRADRANGAVLFAPKKFEPHRLGESTHCQLDRMVELFKQHKLAL